MQRRWGGKEAAGTSPQSSVMLRLRFDQTVLLGKHPSPQFKDLENKKQTKKPPEKTVQGCCDTQRLLMTAAENNRKQTCVLFSKAIDAAVGGEDGGLFTDRPAINCVSPPAGSGCCGEKLHDSLFD